jgi:hypothetical protein
MRRLQSFDDANDDAKKIIAAKGVVVERQFGGKGECGKT